MTTLILSQPEVRRLLPMRACMDAVADALKTLARGRAQNPLRWGMPLPEGRGLLGMMPGSTEEPATFGLKVVAVMPGNHGTPYDSHQGVVMLLDPERGLPIAILDGSEVTAIRTAAASGVATEALAREDAGDLAILGSGVQARSHLEAMACARTLRRVRVFSPTRENREAFAERESGRFGVDVEAVDSARAAVEGADLVCAVSSAREPVVEGAWLAPGAHVNAAGACVKSTRELDTAAVARARFYTDSRESTLNEAGDFLIARDEGAIDESHILGELGQVLLGEVAGRGSEDEVTLYESLGIAVEDLVVADLVLRRAREEGVGTEVELGGLKP